MIKFKNLVEAFGYRTPLQLKVEELNKQLLQQYPQLEDLNFYVIYNSNILHLRSIRIKTEFRKQGIGRVVIDTIKKIADENNLIITLSPQPERGYKKKLDKFYRDRGFIHNKGRKKDYRLSSFFGRNMYRRPGVNETNEEGDSLKSVKVLNDVVLIRIAEVAQKQYNAWEQNEEGYDEELGTGGICHLIADDLAGILIENGIECSTVSTDDPHVYLVCKFKEGVYMVDIPYYVYESGGGWTWKKKKNVIFDKGHVVVEKLDSDPEEYAKYTDYI